MDLPEYSLALLLGYDGRQHFLESGHYLKFEVRLVEKSKRVPHGIAYAFTLHDADGNRLVGYDNAHSVPHRGSTFKAPPVASDHWHRTEHDKGRPYQFVSAEKLVQDFFTEVERTLSALGVPFNVIA